MPRELMPRPSIKGKERDSNVSARGLDVAYENLESAEDIGGGNNKEKRPKQGKKESRLIPDRVNEQNKRDQKVFEKYVLIMARPDVSNDKKKRFFVLDHKRGTMKQEELEELEELRVELGISKQGGWKKASVVGLTAEQRNRIYSRETKVRRKFEESALIMAIDKLSPEEKEEMRLNIEEMERNMSNKKIEFARLKAKLLFMFSPDLSLQESNAEFGLSEPQQLEYEGMSGEQWDDPMMGVYDGGYGSTQIWQSSGADVFNYASTSASGDMFPGQWPQLQNDPMGELDGSELQSDGQQQWDDLLNFYIKNYH